MDLSLLKPSVEFKKPKMIVYGTEGIGKSTFASQAPNPIVLDLENGMDLINIPKYKADNFVKVLDLFSSLLSQEHNFEYVLIDSLDWLERLMISHLCHVHNAKSLVDRSCKVFAYGAGEKLLLSMWNDLISILDKINQKKNMGIILTAHCDIKRFDDPLTESYDMYRIKLEKSSSNLVKEWVECILFANWKVQIEGEDMGFNKTINRAKGVGRVLYTEKRPSFEAKNRYSLPPEMPFNWNIFAENVNKFQKSVMKVQLISGAQANEIKELIRSTDTDVDHFISFLIGRGMSPIGEQKIDNVPLNCFDQIKGMLMIKKEKMEKKGENSLDGAETKMQ